MSVAALVLGDVSRDEAAGAVARQFGGARITWLDRRQLRRRPWTLQMGHRSEVAVLVAPDLHQPRLRLTSLVLALLPSKQRWRIDVRGSRERWTLREHLAENSASLIRHLLGCLLALVLARPVLAVLNALIRPRERILKRPARILYLRPQLWLGLEGGGSVAHTAGVIAGLEQAGVDVHTVSSDRLPGVAAPTTVVHPEVWFDGWLRELEDLAYNVAFFLGALRVARRARPHAIYQRHTAFNIAGVLLSRLLNVPLVLEFNSSELWKGRYWGGLQLARAAALVERLNLLAADRVVVVSEVLRRELIAANVPACKVVVVPNAVDPGVFRCDASGAEIRRGLGVASEVLVGFSGTFGAWHGIPTLARALPIVLRARRHVRWLLIGDGPLRHLLDGVASERVHQVGMVPHASMPAYLAACDVLVSPHGRQADDGEFFGSPTKLFEYMATGRPIVASALGQIADVLVDGESALLVPPDDPEALAEAILRLADDACLRARLGHAARHAAEQRHTWRQNAERVLNCFGAV